MVMDDVEIESQADRTDSSALQLLLDLHCTSLLDSCSGAQTHDYHDYNHNSAGRKMAPSVWSLGWELHLD